MPKFKDIFIYIFTIWIVICSIIRFHVVDKFPSNYQIIVDLYLNFCIPLLISFIYFRFLKLKSKFSFNKFIVIIFLTIFILINVYYGSHLILQTELTIKSEKILTDITFKLTDSYLPFLPYKSSYSYKLEIIEDKSIKSITPILKYKPFNKKAIQIPWGEYEINYRTIKSLKHNPIRWKFESLQDTLLIL